MPVIIALVFVAIMTAGSCGTFPNRSLQAEITSSRYTLKYCETVRHRKGKYDIERCVNQNGEICFISRAIYGYVDGLGISCFTDWDFDPDGKNPHYEVLELDGD